MMRRSDVREGTGEKEAGGTHLVQMALVASDMDELLGSGNNTRTVMRRQEFLWLQSELGEQLELSRFSHRLIHRYP